MKGKIVMGSRTVVTMAQAYCNQQLSLIWTHTEKKFGAEI